MNQIEVFEHEGELECSMCDREVECLVRMPILNSKDDAWIGWCEDCCKKLVAGFEAIRAKTGRATGVWSWLNAGRQNLDLSRTVIGPGALGRDLREGDFAVTCREDGEQLVIHADGAAEWVGEMSLKQVADGAAATLVSELWKPDVSEEARAVALTRLYDRMDDESRQASFGGIMDAAHVLALFALTDNEARAVPLLRFLDRMTREQRRVSLERLIRVGLDVSRKAKHADR